MSDQPSVHHLPAERRFEANVDGQASVLDYRLQEAVMYITHTGVPESLRGRGIAAALVQAAFRQAREEGWKVVPSCSYAAVWASRHPEVSDQLA